MKMRDLFHVRGVHRVVFRSNDQRRDSDFREIRSSIPIDELAARAKFAWSLHLGVSMGIIFTPPLSTSSRPELSK